MRRIRQKHSVRVIPVRLPDKIVEKLDKLVQEGYYVNRSAAIRIIVTHHMLNVAERKIEI